MILDFQHSSGPAPAYAVESDSEDERWADEPTQAGDGMATKTGEPAGASLLAWQPTDPRALAFPGHSGLLVLVGDAGLVVASGLPAHLRSPAPQASLFHLNHSLLLSHSASLVLSPRHTPLELQSALAHKLLADLRPPNLTIISTYQAQTYIPAADNYPIRFLTSSVSDPSSTLPQNLQSLGCQHFQVPNLIKGFEAALMIQANILKIDSKIILLPAISIPHDDKSSTSIPAGQYDFSSGSTGIEGRDSGGLPSSLLGLADPSLRRTLGAVIDHVYLQHLPPPPDAPAHHQPQTRWRFPSVLEPALKDAFRMQLNLDQQFKPKTNQTAGRTHDVGLMFM